MLQIADRLNIGIDLRVDAVELAHRLRIEVDVHGR